MTDKDYAKVIELTYMGGGFIPCNENAINLSETCAKGEVLSFMEVTARDINRHRGYMGLLKYIYDYLPAKFHRQIPESKFYLWLKHLAGNYDVVFEFHDGTKLVEYKSISFARMTEKEFREYIKNQLPFIYENVIGKFFEGEIYNNIIDNIEEEFERYLSKL